MRDVGTTVDGIILGGVLSGLVPRYCVEERQEMHRNLREDPGANWIDKSRTERCRLRQVSSFFSVAPVCVARVGDHATAL